MKKSFSLVTTTINYPKLIIDYVEDAIKFKIDLREVIIIGDLKTPKNVDIFSKKIEKKYKIKCTYMSPKNQTNFLLKYKSIQNFIPWNCIQRRNVGLLKFYENKSDICVVIDDDNFVKKSNYFKDHEHVGSETNVRVIESETGFGTFVKC